MTVSADITIIGAGPYGLSLAAHLREYGVDFHIVGHPMQNWQTNMPKGMLLKSAGFASTLYDPRRSFTLQKFCADQGLPYEDVDLPIPVETFCAYGLAFQKRFAPDLEETDLVEITRCAEGFELELGNGNSLKSRKVVLAAGIDYFRHIPKLLARLPHALCTHSAEHHDLDRFRGHEVAVIGAGASASDLAILLHEAGAKVHLVARSTQIPFGGPWIGSRPSLWRRMRAPISGIGPGWRNLIYTKAPWIFQYMPEHMRIRTVKKHLGPAGGWFMKERAAPVASILGCEIRSAEAVSEKVHLRLELADGTSRNLEVDHVIAATGYESDVRKLPFLGPDIIERLDLIENTPRLSKNFESSIPGLHFAGPIAAMSFGPSMRFAVGADFTARSMSRYFARSAAARPRAAAASRIATGVQSEKSTV